MKFIPKRLGTLNDGYYLAYYNLYDRKFMYIIIMMDNVIHILTEYNIFKNPYQLEVERTDYENRRVHANQFDKSGRCIIFELSEEEFMLEMAGEL